MRNLTELIILIRGGGEVGSAIAHRLYRSHFRVCITELPEPLSISRGTSFSEAIFDNTKTVEDVSAERAGLSIEQIYRAWRSEKIPVVVDPECSVKALIKPDVIIGAMMLKRKTGIKISAAPLVVGIGPGYTAGEDVHLVIESDSSSNLGKVIFRGTSEGDTRKSANVTWKDTGGFVLAADSGVFSGVKNIGDDIAENEILGYLGEVPIISRIAGLVHGILRNDTKVLNGLKVAEIVPEDDNSICFSIRNPIRAISGGVLEAIMFSFNCPD